MTMTTDDTVTDPETGEMRRLPDPSAPPVQVALAAAAAAVGAIPKADVNKDQGFAYRGIERILAGVGPALHRAGVVVLPRVLNVHREEMLRGANKNVWRLVTLTVEYLFVGPAGDSLSAVVLGEGLDNGDKAVSKAMTMAYKSALLQALQIADADTDPDASTPPEQVREDAPPPVLFMSGPNVQRVRTACAEKGLTDDEVAEMALLATSNRTAVLEEAYATEVAQLRDAMNVVLERKASPVARPNDDDAWWLSLAPKVRSLVDPEAKKQATSAEFRKLVPGLAALGVETDDDQRRVLGLLLGVPVHSRAHLTQSQVAAVISVLDEEAAG